MRRTGLVILSLVVSLTGCAGIARTEGASGPLAWRVTDMGSVTRNIGGQAVETYDFTLVIKNISDRTLAFTRIERTVYEAGGGQPGRSAQEGRWELRPGVERRFPMYSFMKCTDSFGCLDRGGAQPMWRLVFLGADDQQRPVESRFEIILPPRSAPKYTHVAAAAYKPAPPADLGPEGSIVATAKPESPTTQVTARATAPTLTAEVPAWRRGDEWEFRWESPTNKGVFVWTVDHEETVEGATAYVIKVGTREIFYRKSDIALIRETLDGTLVLANTPPRLRYAWPLTVGKTWEQTLSQERASPRNSEQRADIVTVEAEETVTVPAGTFQTLKLVYRNKDTQAILYEEWYAPAVKHPVLFRERLTSGGLRVRELTSYSVQ